MGSNQPRSLRVLIVEDHADTRDTLAIILELSGHHVQAAKDGPAALQMAQALQPDVVLIDLGLPKMDGYEVVRRLRTLLPSKPLLVAITGYGQEKDRQRSQEEGFHHHLLKPIEAAQLGDLLRTYAATRDVEAP